MAAAIDLAPAPLQAAAVRRALAQATEDLRALELPAEAWEMREIALTALRALAMALFADAHAEGGHPGALAGLLAEEVDRVTALLAAPKPAQSANARTPVRPAVGRWGS